METVSIDMPFSPQQHSSDSMQNNNGDNRSPVSTGVGAQENVAITNLLESGASKLGVLVCVWMTLMLVQGGIFVTLCKRDRVCVTVLFFLVCFRCWHYFYPKVTGSLTEPTRSLSADNIQQLVRPIPIGFISRLFYRWNLVSVMTCVVLSMMRLASQDFDRRYGVDGVDAGARNFVINVFYGLAFAEALVLLIARTFVTIMAVQQKVRKALIEYCRRSLIVQPALALPAH